jgi:ferredoxin
MAVTARRRAENAPGKYFVDDTCIFCMLCGEIAPVNFGLDFEEGFSRIISQPANLIEETACAEALENCPVNAIGNFG